MPSALLAELAEIRTGYTLRGRPTPGPVHVVQIADLDGGGVLDPADADTTTDETPGPEHRLRAGDVLLASRGVTNPAVLVPHDRPGAVASSYLYVVRVPADGPLDPAFLAWYLNTPRAQDHFTAQAHGSYSVRRVRLDDVGALVVPLPPRDVQAGLARAAQLAAAEADLTRDLADRRLALATHLLLQTALHHG
jgi:hypothetical protein